jgi:hypothetical protein
MSKPANGFLADDGSFFENEPECQRYEAMKELEALCESHGTNYENFMAMLNGWHSPIGRYYDADDRCEAHQVGKPVELEEERADDGFVDESINVPAFLSSKRDHANASLRDKDAPGFLEQSLRVNK